MYREGQKKAKERKKKKKKKENDKKKIKEIKKRKRTRKKKLKKKIYKIKIQTADTYIKRQNWKESKKKRTMNNIQHVSRGEFFVQILWLRFVQLLKRMFLVFKQYYMYFYIFFIHMYFYTCFQFLSTCIKHSLSLLFSLHFGEKIFWWAWEKTLRSYYLFSFLSTQPNTF